MTRSFSWVAVPLSFLLLAPAGPTRSRSLIFAERVAAQRAIEHVYHGHRIGGTRSFENTIPDRVLERKVRDYLKQSVALERFWKTPVTAEMLQRELERIVRDGQMPARLREIFSALGNDSVLIQECLARPVVVDRLVRNFYAHDRRLHSAELEEAERLRASVVGAGEIGPLREERERFVFEVMPNEAPVETFSVKKRPYEEWWAQASLDLDPTHAGSAALSVSLGLAEAGTAADSEAWLPTPDVLWRRSGHSTVWTGSEMIVWGGFFKGQSSPQNLWFDDGARYDPVLDSWTPIGRDGAPDARRDHKASWTGSEMLVWGGYNSDSVLNTGGRYDPAENLWSPISSTGAPQERTEHSMVWTGSEMIVWGGRRNSIPQPAEGGGRYDPSLDTWQPLSTDDEPALRYGHAAVWTGSEMIVWGGLNPLNLYALDTGGRYDPDADRWKATASTAAPAARFIHSAVWTGTEMIVWGGCGDLFFCNPLLDGGRYDPRSDGWTPTSPSDVPLALSDHTAVWTGTEMIVWGGCMTWYGITNCQTTNGGGQYDPVSDQWTAMNVADAPSNRSEHTAVWTGHEMIVWGGANANTGGRYFAEADSWTPTSTEESPFQDDQTAVWTGTEMIVWPPGAEYDPLLDRWSPITAEDEPSSRTGHTAVWTGDEMIVWGGRSGGSATQSGGRYDPSVDSWSPTSTTGAPAGREDHTAVWTGDEMIVWGGRSGGSATQSGGRYDPAVDSWSATSTTGAPAAREDYTAVWTGDEMIVWGGDTGGSATQSGGRYDPAVNGWSATITTGAPTGRANHTAVWTGEEMIVWGGSNDSSGGRYDPSTDSWVATSTDDAPPPLWLHSAVWTGTEMIVWDGIGPYAGGRYEPAMDGWTSVTTTNGPPTRARHNAVWTGSEMIVGGGSVSAVQHQRSGGRYRFGFGECGDGTVDDFEQCDDENLVDGDGCDSNCTPTGCSNRIVTAGEECDDGIESVGCDADCTLRVCGDGTLNTTALEECDDGNNIDGDGCSADCEAGCGTGTAFFGQMILAPGPSIFDWAFPVDVDFVRGDLAQVSGYIVIEQDSIAAATAIPALETPAPDSGFYYLVRVDCLNSTWGSGGAGECNPPGVCPSGGRDGNLPSP